MDEQTRALYQQLLGELYRRMEKDPEIRRALKRVEEGKATFRDTAVWSDRSAELLGTVFSEAIGDMPAEARESLCKALLRERYDSTFDLCGEVQEALDKRQGIALKPVKPKFPAERVQQIAHSLIDPTVAAATIERRARAPVATAARSFHDDYIRENASVRTDLGFKCYLDRIAAPGCCKWCTSVAGRYVYGDHPDEVFHRHDNCACTVTFENGRERQDVWSKRTWDAHDPKEIERLASAETVFSEEEASSIEMHQLSEIHGIDFRSLPGKDIDAVADMEYIDSDAFALKFKGKYENENVEQAVIAACRQIVKNRNGTYFEEAIFIDAHTGATISYVKGKKKNGVDIPKKLKKRLTNARESSIIMIHNHPNSSPLSRPDYLTSSGYECCYEALAVGHNGDVFCFRGACGTRGEFLGYFMENGIKYPYYEAIRDYRVSYSKHLIRGESDFESRNSAWKEVAEIRGFIYEKR